jgi:uncharacterized protein (TIGR03066 family)
MKLLPVLVVGCLLGGGMAALADDKSKDKGKDKGSEANAEKIVGTWEVTKGERLMPGSTLELTKDGKITIRAKQGEIKLILEGKYKVDGDNLTVTLKFKDAENTQKMQIKKLTDTELVTVNVEMVSTTFKKVK